MARPYNPTSKFEKKDLIATIVKRYGDTIVSRKDLVALVDKEAGLPWALFRFIANDKTVKSVGKRGFYDLDLIKGFEGFASEVLSKTGGQKVENVVVPDDDVAIPYVILSNHQHTIKLN